MGISIQPLLLFNNVLYPLSYLFYFNTTLVTIQRYLTAYLRYRPKFQYNPCYYSTCFCFTLKGLKLISIQPLLLFNFWTRNTTVTVLISIQPLLLFNRDNIIRDYWFLEFQYNPCYYSTRSVLESFIFLSYFNTTLVTIQH